MKIGRVLRVAGFAAAFALISQNAYAFDLNGAWATDAGACGLAPRKT